MPSPSRNGAVRPSMWRGVPLFLSMPLTSKRLPPRLSGYKRSNFNYALFLIHAWKHLNRRRRIPKTALPAEAFAEYIGSWDDLIDQMGSPSTGNVKHYHSNLELRGHMSRFVKGVKREKLSARQRKEIFKLAGDFRRDIRQSLQRFEKEEATLQNVLRMKEETSGGYGRVITAILNVGNNIPPKRRWVVENAFADATMALQISDDLMDLRIDRVQRTHNVVESVLKEHPEEYARATQARRPTPRWLRKYCPQSYAHVERLLGEYLSRLPSQTAGEKAFQALPRIIWGIAQFRRG